MPPSAPFLLLLLPSSTLAALSCHYYLGNLGNGANLGPPVPGSTPSDCCAACMSTQSCVAFTFTSPGDSACYLHPSPGDVDSGSSYISGVCFDDDIMSSDPFAIPNGAPRSGVPLGGVGVGFFDLAPAGNIARVAVNNWHQDGVVTDMSRGTFLAVWDASRGGAQLLQTVNVSGPLIDNLNLASNVTYTGMFPTVNLTVDAAYSVYAWSPLIPHDVANSSLPLAYLEVTLRNPTSSDVDMAAAVSWQDVIARRMFDASTAQLDAYYGDSGVCGWDTDVLRNAMSNAGIDVPNTFARVATNASYLQLSRAGWTGLVQSASTPVRPNKYTLQHYVNRFAIVAEVNVSAGDVQSFIPSYAVGNATAASAAWAPFISNGVFAMGADFAPQALYTPSGAAGEAASAVAVRVRVPPGGQRVVKFMLSWTAEQLRVSPGQDNRTYCGTSDYNKQYHNSFNDVADVLAYAAAARDELLAGTAAIASAVRASTYPAWLQFKIINSAYTMFTNTILNAAGHFSVMEGGMGGLAGTMDQRISAHPFYWKFFTATDTLELAQFGAAAGPDGSILHFDADLYAGVTGTDGVAILAGGEYHDNTMGWLYQLAKSYECTGDVAPVLAQAARLQPALDFIASTIPAQSPYLIPGGSNTYDDFWELCLDVYMAGLYPTFLQSAAVLATALGNTSLAAACTNASIAAAMDAQTALYTGSFYAYGAACNGSGVRSDIMASGQMAGPFLTRYAAWNDTLPFDTVASSIVAQLQTNVGSSFSFYAPKVWNLTSQSRAIDPTNGHPSSTWPFYLESYTALAAAQAGYVNDSLAILQQLQLVNARLGLTWCQNLWNPGFITYVTAPVSWFATDVFAGFAVHAGGSDAGTLYVSPAIDANGTDVVSMPVFTPTFWAVVDASAPARSLTVTITRTYAVAGGPTPPVFTMVAALPAGQASQAAAWRRVQLPTSFTVATGAVLDLSQWWDTLMGAELQPRVLPMLPPL